MTDFNIRAFQEILQVAQEEGYEAIHFSDPRPSKALYLRHDVDNSLHAALTIAEVEASRGFKSTYLCLLRSPNYNLLDPVSLDAIDRIASLGHEIGLHFICPSQKGSADGLRSLIQRDAEFLERIIGRPIGVFSFHNPSQNNQFQIDVPGLINTYAPPFFDDIRYLSESNMAWGSGPPIDILRSGEPVVQLLTHPLSFVADLRTDRDVLLYFLHSKLVELKLHNESENRTLSASPIPWQDVCRYLAAQS